MKKRVLALALAAMMMLSLAACGGVKKDAAIDAFNAANTKITEINNLANANLDSLDEANYNLLTQLSAAMQSYKDEIESKDVTQERLDEITGLINGMAAELDTLKAGVEASIAGAPAEGEGEADPATDAEAPITDEQREILAQLGTDLTDVGALYGDYYDNLDDNTKAFVQMIADTIADIALTVTDGSGATSAYAETLIAGSQEILEAAQTGLAELQAQAAEG